MFQIKDTDSICTVTDTSIIVMILPRLFIKYWNSKLQTVLNKR